MDAQAEVLSLLKTHKAALLRTKKHNVWMLPSGKRWVTPKTASDSHSWSNNLNGLLTALGLKTKNQPAPSEQREKKQYVKAVEPKKDFLADIPEREAPAPRPVHVVMTPPPTELPIVDDAPARYIFSIGGKVPILRKGGGRKSSGRSGAVHTYSPEVMSHAQRLLDAHGPNAMRHYLNQIKEEEAVMTPVNGAAVQTAESAPATAVDGPRRTIGNGPIEQEIATELNYANDCRAQAQRLMDEAARAEQTASLLQKALAIKTRAVTKAARVPSSSSTTGMSGVRVNITGVARVERGFWPRALASLLPQGTFMTREQLSRTLLAKYPDQNMTNVSQAVTNNLTLGKLERDQNGNIRWVG